MDTFATRLKAAMDQAEMNQTDLHAATNISKASISQYLSGKNVPTKARISVLAEALKVEDDFLTGYESPMTTAPQAALSSVLTPLKITVEQAARCMKKSDRFVKDGLKRGAFLFGGAIPGSGDKFTYFINPDQFRAYVGETLFTAYFGRFQNVG